MLLDGVHIPLTTPFYPDGEVYYRKLEHNVRRYSLTPGQGLVVLGPAGESEALTTDEKRAVLRTVADTAAAEKVLTAVISEAGVLPAVALANYAAELHYDAVLLQAPFAADPFWWRDEEPSPELLVWFQAMADRSRLPIVIASSLGSRDLPVAFLASIASHPNVVGILEQSNHISRVAELKHATGYVKRTSRTTVTFTAATGRMLLPKQQEAGAGPGTFISAQSLTGGTALAEAPAATTLITRTKETGMQILWAHADQATEAMRAGAGGISAHVAAAVPQAVFEIWAAWKDGDTALMQQKQQRVAIAEQFFQREKVAALKAGAELSGYFGGRPRLPLLALPKEKQDTLAALLNGMRS